MKIHTLICLMISTSVLLIISTPLLGQDGSTWIRTYAGGYGHSIFPTDDGGLMMAGTYGAGTGNCCQPWLIKLSSDGSVLWQKIYEAAGLAGANNILPTSDGGYIMAAEAVDFLVLKLDGVGNVEWAKNYGEGGGPLARVFITPDEDYLVLGVTKIEDDLRSNGRILKLDQQGNILWQKVYGHYGIREYFTGATTAYNGNYIITGMNGGDYWVLELDPSGNIVWEKIYGGPFEDQGRFVTKIPNNKYLVVGSSDSFAQGGLRNLWILVLNKSGKLRSQQSFGGLDAEVPNAAIATSDGGYMIGGGTGSYGAGGSDIWLMKFDSRNRIQWQKTYGLSRTEHAWQIYEFPSGGYAVIGDSYSYPDEYYIWLMKIDEQGNIQYGECGFVEDAPFEPIKTKVSERNTSVMVIDTDIQATSFKIAVSEQSVPIEDCFPVITGN
jgi:hypothetical protein